MRLRRPRPGGRAPRGDDACARSSRASASRPSGGSSTRRCARRSPRPGGGGDRRRHRRLRGATLALRAGARHRRLAEPRLRDDRRRASARSASRTGPCSGTRSQALALYRQRLPAYRRADLTVDVGPGEEAEEVAARIALLIGAQDDALPDPLRHARQLGRFRGRPAPCPPQALRRRAGARRPGGLRRRRPTRWSRRCAGCGRGPTGARQPRQGGGRGRGRRATSTPPRCRRRCGREAADRGQPALRPRPAAGAGRDRATGLAICHGSPLDEDTYVFSDFDAYEIFSAHEVPVTFFGHTHIPSLFVPRRGRHRRAALRGRGHHPARPEGRYLVNPGSIGQPRDRDPRASYMTYDSDRRVVRWYRVPYPIARAQSRIRKAGLPAVLADRLAVGA